MVPAETKIDPVTGPITVKAHYESCVMARLSFGPCGKEGKFWAPKNKPDLFKFIKHVSS